MSVYKKSGYAKLVEQADAFNHEQQKVLLVGPFATNDVRVLALLERLTEVTGVSFPSTTAPDTRESLADFIQRISAHITGIGFLKSSNRFHASYSLSVTYKGSDVFLIQSESSASLASKIGGNKPWFDKPDVKVLIFANANDEKGFTQRDVTPFNLYMGY